MSNSIRFCCNFIWLLSCLFVVSNTHADTIYSSHFSGLPVSDNFARPTQVPGFAITDQVVMSTSDSKKYHVLFIDTERELNGSEGSIVIRFPLADANSRMHVVTLRSDNLNDYYEISSSEGVFTTINFDGTARQALYSETYVYDDVKAVMVLVSQQQNDSEFFIDWFPEFNGVDGQGHSVAELVAGQGAQSWHPVFYDTVVEGGVRSSLMFYADALKAEKEQTQETIKNIEDFGTFMSYSFAQVGGIDIKGSVEMAATQQLSDLLCEGENRSALVSEPCNAIISQMGSMIRIYYHEKALVKLPTHATLFMELSFQMAKVVEGYTAASTANQLLRKYNNHVIARRLLSHKYVYGRSWAQTYSFYGLDVLNHEFKDLVDAVAQDPLIPLIDIYFKEYDESLVNRIFLDYINKSSQWIEARAYHGNPYADVDGDGCSNKTDIAPNDPSACQPAENQQPVAGVNFEGSGTHYPGDALSFNGNSSYDPEGSNLSYNWQLTPPTASKIQLSDHTSRQVSFTPDVFGSYKVSLTVSDGNSWSRENGFTVKVEDKDDVVDEFEDVDDVDADHRYDILSERIAGCGDIDVLRKITVPEGVYWRNMSFIIGSGSQDFYLLFGYNKPPTEDRDYSDEKCQRYGQTSVKGFDYDYRFEHDGGNGIWYKDWNKSLGPGESLYIALASRYDESTDISSVTIVKYPFKDKDGDGVSDEQDFDDNDPSEWVDSDGDGVGDNRDVFDNDPAAWQDSDSDGCPDAIVGNGNTSLLADSAPFDGAICVDNDGDGQDDRVVDRFPADPNEWADTDEDGVGDNGDAFPTDPAAAIDSDNDGYPDSWIAGRLQGDSTANLSLDQFPFDPSEWLDSDGDGYGNNTDWAPFNTLEWLDSDNDGVGDNADVAPNDASRTSNSAPEIAVSAQVAVTVNETLELPVGMSDADNDPLTLSLIGDVTFATVGNNAVVVSPTSGEHGEYSIVLRVTDGFGGSSIAVIEIHVLDADSDSDGIFDSVDNCRETANPDQTNSDGENDGGDACDSDDDNDGVTDENDAFPTDASESLDTDRDGIGDNADLDDDNDRLPDDYEVMHGLNPFDPNDAQKDTDGDGFSNFHEYQAGTSPSDKGSLPVYIQSWIHLLLSNEQNKD